MNKPIIELKNASLNKGNRFLLKDINLQIYQGEVIALLGHNGSGKSTLLKVLTQKHRLTEGTITLPPAKSSVSIMTQQPEDSLFNELTLRENIMLRNLNKPKKAQQSIEAILKNCPRGERLEKFLDKPVSKLSGGEKQLFLLGLLLAFPPSILFLDEHTSNLDRQAATDVMKKTLEVVKEKQITTMMITHDLDAASHFCDRFLILKEGLLIRDFASHLGMSAAALNAAIFIEEWK